MKRENGVCETTLIAKNFQGGDHKMWEERRKKGEECDRQSAGRGVPWLKKKQNTAGMPRLDLRKQNGLSKGNRYT